MIEHVFPFAQGVALLVFCGLLLAAAVGDVRTFRIPNALNLAIAASFFVLAVPLGLGLDQIMLHGAWFIGISVVCLVGFYFGLFGGGDAKMIGAVSAWMGPAGLAPFLVMMAICGGLLALVLMGSRRIARKAGLPAGPRWLRQILRRKAGVPYGVAISAGALLALPSLPWVTIF
ncbi:MAG: prepilin peptidase [Hyphomonadaceae bacterium]|jgi:prepilin peptidase CpaA|nr:prepilin peptidase [Hyphomonadaceae bacterium]